MALRCPRYGWPRMLKVAPFSALFERLSLKSCPGSVLKLQSAKYHENEDRKLIIKHKVVGGRPSLLLPELSLPIVKIS